MRGSASLNSSPQIKHPRESRGVNVHCNIGIAEKELIQCDTADSIQDRWGESTLSISHRLVEVRNDAPRTQMASACLAWPSAPRGFNAFRSCM